MSTPNHLYKTPRGEAAIRLAEIPDEGLKLTAAEVRPQPAGIDLLDPVRLDLKLMRDEAGGYALVGGFPFRVRVVCCRCSEPFDFSGKSSFAYFMLPAAEAPKADETHLDTADMDCVYYEDDELLLDRVAEEQLVLAVPDKPLCREDCLGLCPECGENRNSGACRCPPGKAGAKPSVFDKIAEDFFGDKK
jgi:uncharacterized protein